MQWLLEDLDVLVGAYPDPPEPVLEAMNVLYSELLAWLPPDRPQRPL